MKKISEEETAYTSLIAFASIISLNSDVQGNDLIMKALDTATQALRKRIPMKPIEKDGGVYVCKGCGKKFLLPCDGYFCKRCGQATDWGEIDG